MFHVGPLTHWDTGNEKADTSAYEAITSLQSIKISSTSSFEIFGTIHQKIMEEWQLFWENIPLTNKLRNTKLLVKKLNYPNGTKRTDEVTVTRAKIGHSYLTHVHLIKNEPASLCDTCNVTLSIEHIVIICPKYTEARKILQNPASLYQAFKDENTAAISTFFHNINTKHPL